MIIHFVPLRKEDAGGKTMIIKQCGIIFFICWISVILENYLPFPIPAAVIGLILLFFCLAVGILKVEHIKEKSEFLLGNMAFFFVPAAVGIIKYFDVLRESLFSILIITVVSTVITFVVTAYSIRLTIKLMNRRKK